MNLDQLIQVIELDQKKLRCNRLIRILPWFSIVALIVVSIACFAIKVFPGAVLASLGFFATIQRDESCGNKI